MTTDDGIGSVAGAGEKAGGNSFSFVIPACNVAPYAKELVDSLKAQTRADFEAIVVCEESSDGTRGVLSGAIAGDRRFTVIDLPRSGSASVSRNYGIEHASGDYLVFVDGDDWIEPDALERFDEAFRRYGAPDVFLTDWILHQFRGGTETAAGYERCHWCARGKVISGVEALERNLAGEIHAGSPLLVCRRDFLRERRLFQIPGRRMEDDEWVPRVLFEAETVLYTGYAYYHYRKRDGSVTTDSNPETVVSFTDNFLAFLAFVETHPMPDHLLRLWAHWSCRIFFIYFAPSFCRRFPRELREREFRRAAGSGRDFRRMVRIVWKAKWGKRILIPFFFIARNHAGFAAVETFYRHVYWPIVFSAWGGWKRFRLKRKE